MAPQAIYKALSDPTRREILRLLREGDRPAGAIAEHFPISWPSVSRHLSVLSGAGLVASRRDGGHLIYRLTTSVLADVSTELADLARLGAERSRQPVAHPLRPHPEEVLP